MLDLIKEADPEISWERQTRARPPGRIHETNMARRHYVKHTYQQTQPSASVSLLRCDMKYGYSVENNVLGNICVSPR